ncbi:MAG: HNH endonuclease [Actinobacteria bacterium]|nr:HNH endonuclease [Actinomycetota bacterium]
MFMEKSTEERIIDLLFKPGSYEVLGELILINPRELTASGKIDYLAALEKQHSWITSLLQEATLAIAGSQPSESDEMWEGVDESEREDIATALRLSPSTAQIRIDVARTLSNHLPATCEALATGIISSSHATLIARETADALKRGLSPDILGTIEEKAIAHSEFHTPSQVGRKLRTLFAQYAPEEFEQAHEIARDSRSVRIYPEGDGMSTLIALLPAEDAQTVYLAINAMIEHQGVNEFHSAAENFPSKPTQLDESQTMEMKRADALAAIASDFLARISDDYTPRRRPVSLNLTMDLPTMLGLAENPAELSGYGPIPATVARALAADGRWRKFITDPGTGNLLDCGRESYVPPQHLVDFLTARDRICRFPGCSQPARVGDIDHAQSWDDGGNTEPSNLCA